MSVLALLAFQVSKVFIIYILKAPDFYAIQAILEISNAFHLDRNLVWEDNRGLVPTISQMAPNKNIPITKKASDAEPDATSSSSSNFSPVNPIKCLLLWKEKNWNTGAAFSIPAKTTLCFMLPQYGLWICVIVVSGHSIFWSLTPGLAKFTRPVKLRAAMTDGQ